MTADFNGPVLTSTTPRTVPLRMKMVDPSGFCSREWGQYFFGVGQGNGQGFASIKGALAAQAKRLDAVEAANAAQAQTIAQQASAIAQLLDTVERLSADVEALQLAPLGYPMQA